MHLNITPAASVLNLEGTFDENKNSEHPYAKHVAACLGKYLDLDAPVRYISLSVAKPIATVSVSVLIIPRLSAASEITQLYPCTPSHYFKYLYNSLSGHLAYATVILAFDAHFKSSNIYC